MSTSNAALQALRLLELQRELNKYSAIDNYFPPTGPIGERFIRNIWNFSPVGQRIEKELLSLATASARLKQAHLK